MNHTTPIHDLPDSDPYADIRLRIALVRRHIDNLFSLVCKAVLLLMPVLFAVAHIAADGETSNFVRGWKFDPLYDLISTYASRSPAGWAVVACMFGIAYVLGFISWHAAKRGPGVIAWFTSVTAAVGMAMMLQTAWYPMKPSREGFIEIQQEADRKSANQPTTTKSDSVLDFRAVAESNPMSAPKLDASLRSFWIHQQAIGWVQVLILLNMAGALFLWDRRGPDRNYWSRAHWVVLLWIGAGLLGRVWLPNFVGLTQRFAYFGFYFWLLVVVREIERHRSAAAKDEIGMQSLGGSHMLSEDEAGRTDERQNATVTDTPLQS